MLIIYHGGSAPSDTSDVRKHFGARCAGIINHVDGAMGWAPPDDVEVVLNQHLSKNKCFLGEEFSAADIMMGGGINSMIMFKLMHETRPEGILRKDCQPAGRLGACRQQATII